MKTANILSLTISALLTAEVASYSMPSYTNLQINSDSNPLP